VNNQELYCAMKASMLAAGFDEERCLYSMYDNSEANHWDPFAVISQVLEEAETADLHLRPGRVIFCHQDILLNQGHGFDQLTLVLDELDKTEPDWAIAGNAGMTLGRTMLRHISDPFGSNFDIKLPQTVFTLDENFLVVRTGAGLRCSQGVNGFHLYGTDLCLHALMRGMSAHIVDFRLTHCSKGNRNEDMYIVQRNLQAAWNARFMGIFVFTPVTTFALSRFYLVRKLFDRNSAINYIVAHPRLNEALMAISRSLFGRSSSTIQAHQRALECSHTAKE
jgi:hypothetical protein